MKNKASNVFLEINYDLISIMINKIVSKYCGTVDESRGLQLWKLNALWKADIFVFCSFASFKIFECIKKIELKSNCYDSNL